MAPSRIQIDEAELDRRLEQLERARAWSPRVTSKLETFIRTASDFELLRVNPLSYAGERGLAAAEALDLFLHAAHVGLFAMDWHLVCPYCGFLVGDRHSMDQLRSHHVCPTCGVERDSALDDYILVAFSIAPAVRAIAYYEPTALELEDLQFNYCLSEDVLSPMPDFALWRDLVRSLTQYMGYLAPAEKVTRELNLTTGVLRVSDGKNCLQLTIEPERRAAESEISLRLVDGQFRSDDPELAPRVLGSRDLDHRPISLRFNLERRVPSGKLRLCIENQDDQRRALFVYQVTFPGVAMLPLRASINGKKLLTSQTFRDLFRSESVHPDETLSLQDITFLFTDLKGSTAMYERVGDAQAYFLVRQHFDTLGRVIRDQGGAVVKTIGDAVMAVFESPLAAASAALDMIEALGQLDQGSSQELQLKIGIHRGHSMAVTVNERIDFFGQTVNIAARVQALAGGNEVYLTAEVYEALGVSELLKAHHVLAEAVKVKGISEKLHVYKIECSNMT